VFVRVQILQSYPFYNGVYGNESLFLGISYTESLEVFTLLAFVGVISWSYTHARGGRGERLAKAAGNTLLIFGVLVAGIVYAETYLLWGELIPGIHVWQGLPGGGGYPWGSEQVASNTCFVASGVPGDCAFLNYNELLLIALLCALAGFILRYRNPEGSEPTLYGPERPGADILPM